MTISPGGQRLELAKVATITEEFGWWLKGRLRGRHLSDVYFEVSFEDYAPILKRRPDLLPYPNVPVTYLGLWTGKRCHAEFQMGQWCVKPKDDIYLRAVTKILHALQHHKPFAVADQRHRERQLEEFLAMASSDITSLALR